MVNPVPGYPVTTAYWIPGSHWTACGHHTGIDIAAPHGTPVVAARGGELKRVSYGAAFGTDQLLVVAPDGSADFYAHLLRPRGAVPRRVAAGERIGDVGSDGNATGPHLHFERHASAGAGWNCGNMRDPMDSLNDGDGGGGSQWASGAVYVHKLKYGQRDSDSVRRLQYVLNGIPLQGGETLPVTGNYLTDTDDEVRRWQRSIGNTVDPVGGSSIGPLQAARLFPAPPYSVRD